jgi:hypothetical protein
MAIELQKDWRVDNCKLLRSERLRRKKYRAPSEEWDHDHCMACWAKFAESEGPEILNEGYATVADSQWGLDYHWVCLQCFADLHELMEWVEVV